MLIAISTGASARPSMMAAAIIAPGVIWFSTTNHAPVPRMATWTNARKNLDSVTSRPDRSPAACSAAVSRPIERAPPVRHRRHHAHGRHGFRVAHRRVRQPHHFDGRLFGCLVWLERDAFRDEADGEQYQRRRERHHAKIRMQQPDEHDEDRNPRRVDTGPPCFASKRSCGCICRSRSLSVPAASPASCA